MSVRGDRTTAHAPKRCAACGGVFSKISSYSAAQWARARFCSNRCRGTTLTKDAPSLWGDGRYYVRRDGEWIPRARAVVEEARGEPLPAGAVVHHLNRDRADDRLENLRVFASHAEHMRFHAEQGDTGFRLGHPPGLQAAA